MSYIKVSLPELYELKQRIESDKDKWIRFYGKHGAFIGSSESVDYLTNEIEKYYDNKKNTF
jgi:hypothetical protein